MGNIESKQKKADREYNDYVCMLQLVRKEHADNFGLDIDLYKTFAPSHKEDLIVMFEIMIEDSDD